MAVRWLGLTVAVLLLSGCAREAGPEAVALEYARALYARDLARAYRLLSSADRRVKDEETFRRERELATGFALEVTRQLASFIEVVAVEKVLTVERAAVRLSLRLPNANPPEIAALLHEWDERRLNALSRREREAITGKLERLHETRTIPMLEGEDTFRLVREGRGWRVWVGWAGGVRVRFRAVVPEASPLEASVRPAEVLVAPGDVVQVVVRARNLSARLIVTRVSHRVDPEAQARSLALARCLLSLPVTLRPGQTDEFSSEFLLLKEIPREVKHLDVTYIFGPLEQEGARRVR